MRKRVLYYYFQGIVILSILGTIFTGCSQSKTGVSSQEPSQESSQEQNIGQSSGQEIRFTIQQNRMETMSYYTADNGDSFPYMFVNYPSLIISQDMLDDYPELSQYLTEYSDSYYENALISLASVMDIQDEEVSYFTSNYEDLYMEIYRADPAVVSILTTTESYNNGNHPYVYYESQLIDSASGNVLVLSDIVKDCNLLPQAILDNLVTIDDSYEFDDEELASLLSIIQQMVEDDEIPFTLDEEGLDFYFEAYALMSHSFGPIFAELSFEEYPELVYDKYLPVEEVTPLDERIMHVEGETTKLKDEELLPYQIIENTEGDFIQESWFEIDCPDWEVPYLADGIFDTMTSSPITLNEQNKESADYLFADEWSAENGIALPATAYEGSYSDDTYQYMIDNDAENGRLEIMLTNTNEIGVNRHYSFESYIYTPNPANELTRPYIMYAKVFDNTLYVEIAHRSYSGGQPNTAYIVAVDVEQGTLLWRSEMLVANAKNFVVTQDAIICGYGFTSEDDYLFILSRYSGSVLEKRELKSGPEYLITADGLLYVLTNDTVYTYLVETQ